MRILMVASVDTSEPMAYVLHLDGVATALAAAGHQVTLMLPAPGSSTSALAPEGKPYRVVFKAYGARLGIPRPLSFLLQAPGLAIQALRGRFECIYIRAGVLSWPLTLALRLTGRPRLVLEHNGWIADELRVMGSSSALVAAASTLQTLDAHAAHANRCVTAGIARKLMEAGVAAEKQFVAGNGTDLQRFFPMPREAALAARGLAPEPFYIGFIGSLAVWHGVHDAVRALPAIVAANPHVRMLIAGSGSERPRLEAMVKELRLEGRVQFLGRVPTAEANAVINCFDLAISPQISERNSDIGLSPIKIRDYSAAGRAILSTDIEGIAPPDDRDWIALCPPDDPAAFARAATALIGDDARRRHLSTAARAYAERNFAWTGIAARILERV